MEEDSKIIDLLYKREEQALIELSENTERRVNVLQATF